MTEERERETETTKKPGVKLQRNNRLDEEKKAMTQRKECTQRYGER